MQMDVKNCIHHGHLGVVRCKRRARESVFWPNLNNEIELMLSQCSECLDERNRQQKVTLIEHDVPKRPWEKVGADLMTIHGSDYLLVVDYYSKYFEIAPLETPSDSPESNCDNEKDI